MWFLPWFPWFPWFHPQAVVRCNEAEALVIHILLQSPQLHPKISHARDASPLSSHPLHLFEPKLLPKEESKMKREEKRRKVTNTQSFATVLSRVPTSGWKKVGWPRATAPYTLSNNADNAGLLIRNSFQKPSGQSQVKNWTWRSSVCLQALVKSSETETDMFLFIPNTSH